MMNQNQQATNLPIDRKILRSIREAAKYSNIGINKIDEMLKIAEGREIIGAESHI